MFVDASVMIAIISDESDAEALNNHLEAAQSRVLITSVVAVWETVVVVFKQHRLSMTKANARVQEFLDLTNIEVLPVANEDLTTALQAFERYGRHRYPSANRNSALNLADCFHYATAQSHRTPILTKDAGFALTDLEAIGVAKDQ